MLRLKKDETTVNHWGIVLEKSSDRLKTIKLHKETLLAGFLSARHFLIRKKYSKGEDRPIERDETRQALSCMRDLDPSI